MAGTYCNITKAQMEAFLFPKGFKPLSLPGVIELVYAKIVHHENYKCSLRVYTGINPSGESRAVGEDAIRVEAFYRIDDNDTPARIGGSKRVNRITSWQFNLDARLDGWQKMLGPICPACNAPMVERTVKNGPRKGEKFWAAASTIKQNAPASNSTVLLIV